MSAPALGLFEGAYPRVRNAPPSAPILDVLAERMIAELARADDPFALSDAIILLPNRRATRALMAAFAARQSASLLPAIRPLGDLDDDPDVWGPDPAAFNADPAIEPLRRRLELAALLRTKAAAEGGVDDPVLAVATADELCKLLDAAAAAENVDWRRLPDLVADKDLAQHWARSAAFLKIIGEYWPQRLALDGLMDPGARRTSLLNALADQWTREPPQTPIVIAGSTGSVAAVRRLMGVVANLPRGVVILPGLDNDLDDEAWEKIEPQHPQFGLRETLHTLRVDRRAISALAGAEETKSAAARRALVREALAPADITADWIARMRTAAAPYETADAFIAAATGDLILCEARTEDEEANIAALALREALETPGRTAALVTPDSNLAQRVAAKLRRWGVDAALSAGTPLAETAPGILLTLLAELAADDGDPVALAALAGHPLVEAGTAEEKRAFVNAFLRGARRRPDLATMARDARAEEAKDEQKLAVAAIDAIASMLSPLRATFSEGTGEANQFAEKLAEAAERAAAPASPWTGRAGDAAVQFLQTLAESGDALGPISPAQTPRLIASLMAGKTVAPDTDDDPRIAIWGPLEARLQNRDLIVLGGLNEGQWPAPPPDDPFLSRGLRGTLGLPPADARIGLAAHDFAQLANAPRVVLTRAQRREGAPTVASRWVWRLEALVRAAGGDLRKAVSADELIAWAEILDAPVAIGRTSAPRPIPASKGLRISALSVTDVEKLVRDPYSIYAKRILGLYALDAIGTRPGPAERGTAVHDALDQFQRLADGDSASLMALLDINLIKAGFAPERRSAYLARVAETAEDFTAWAAARRNEGIAAKLEIKGVLDVEGVPLTGRADRIDIKPNGRADIIDYKTGAPPTNDMVKSGFAPQLLLEAAILEAGQFEKLAAALTDSLIYWRFGASGAGARTVKTEEPAEDAARTALAALKALLKKYDQPDQPFVSRPRVRFVDDYSDYDHLARLREWADLGGGE